MADVKPFRAVRYDEAIAGPLETLVAPPYDVLGAEERRDYLASSPHNVVHLTLPESEEAAAETWRDWLDTGVLAREEERAYWAVRQDSAGPDGVARTRTGLFASLRVEPYERKVVLPHERTHRGPKEGRLRLLRATNVQLEPIFLLYEGQPPFEIPDRNPDLAADGASLWRLDASTESADFFASRQLLIADGHHRYETSLAYHEARGTDESAYMPVVLVSLSDPGLMIFPTHRMAADLNGRSFPVSPGDPRLLLEDLAREPRDQSVAVVYRREGTGTLHGRQGELDVELVERYAQDVTYTADANEAIAAVDAGEAEAAFLLRPLRVEEVFAAAASGRVLPQKTTYFYPKLLSGLLFHPV